MSSLWTPAGEHPVDRDDPAAPPGGPAGGRGAGRRRGSRRLARRGRRAADDRRAAPPAGRGTPPRSWSPTTATGCSSWPPSTSPSSRRCSTRPGWRSTPWVRRRGLGGRLGEAEPRCSTALAQIQLAFVQIGRRPSQAPPRPGEQPATAPRPAPDGQSGTRPRASSRPRWPATTTKRTRVPTSIRRVPSAIAVQWKRSAGAVVAARRCRGPGRSSNVGDAPPVRGPTGAPAGHQWTILESASSRMSVAPWSFSAGMSMLISVFGDHGLDGVAAVAGQLGDRRRLQRRQHADHRLELGRRARSA